MGIKYKEASINDKYFGIFFHWFWSWDFIHDLFYDRGCNGKKT